jgi:molecular chaperone DnaK (HSP70)
VLDVALQRAGAVDGRIINEPTAAALAYGLGKKGSETAQDVPPGAPARVLVPRTSNGTASPAPLVTL